MESEIPTIDIGSENSPVESREIFLRKVEIRVYGKILKGIASVIRIVEPKPRLRKKIFETTMDVAGNMTKLICGQDMKAHQPELMPFTENNNFKRYSEILEEGLRLFKAANPDRPITFFLADDSNSLSQVSEILTIENKEIEGLTDVPDMAVQASRLRAQLTSVDSLVYRIIDSLPYKKKELIEEAKFQIGHIGEELEDESNLRFRQWLETKRAEVGRPLFQAELIAKSLENSSGNLSQALYFLQKYFYISTRSEDVSHRDIESDTRQKNDVEAVARTVLDELSEFTPFNELKYEEPKYQGKLRTQWRKTIGGLLRSKKYDKDEKYYDFSLNNRVGELYHATHIVTLLSDFPPEALAIFIMGEYLNYGEFQGLCKFLADLRVVADLYNVKAVINKYRV